MIDEQTRPAVAPEKKLQPPARWRNWWRAKTLSIGVCDVCASMVELSAGEVFGNCCRRYPSQEVAEIVATRHNNGTADYLGAYREGERP